MKHFYKKHEFWAQSLFGIIFGSSDKITGYGFKSLSVMALDISETVRYDEWLRSDEER